MQTVTLELSEVGSRFRALVYSLADGSRESDMDLVAGMRSCTGDFRWRRKVY